MWSTELLPLGFHFLRLPPWLSSKDSTYKAGDTPRLGFNPWVGKIPLRRTWQPMPVFLPRSPGQEEPGRLQSMGVARSQTWLKQLSIHACTHSFPHLHHRQEQIKPTSQHFLHFRTTWRYSHVYASHIIIFNLKKNTL